MKTFSKYFPKELFYIAVFRTITPWLTLLLSTTSKGPESSAASVTNQRKHKIHFTLCSYCASCLSATFEEGDRVELERGFEVNLVEEENRRFG